MQPKSPALVPRLASHYPFRDRFLSVRGLRCHYVDEGRGRPVIMLHGNPTWSFHFRTLIEGLKDGYRAIAMDYIGMGLSDKPDDSRYQYRLQSRVDDLAFLIDSLGLDEPLTLVMHDWGGMIGMAYASRWPERIARLVLLNTAAFHVPSGMKVPFPFRFVRNTRLGAWLARRFNIFSRTAARICCKRRPMTRELRNAYCGPYDNWANRIGILRFVQDVPLDVGDTSYALVSHIEASLHLFRQVPVLICWGDRDFVFTPPVLDVWRHHWPHAQVHRFPECGHYLLEDAPAEVGRLVRAFLDSPAV